MIDIGLDRPQSNVVSSQPGRRQAVIAGPGSGKTTTAALLARELLASTDSDRSIVFVSFSTAALQSALNAFSDLTEDDQGRIVATTLDSLAGQLIEYEYSSDKFPRFDDIVTAAVAHLAVDYDEELDDVIHLIVDEAQDLSEPRRALLTAIIARLPDDAGFTIFGDPMQAIYGFLDRGMTGDDAWGSLIAQLQADSPIEVTVMTGDYRPRSSRTKRISAALSTIRDSSATRTEVQQTLDDALLDVSFTTPDHLSRQIPKWSGTTAVLSRTNVEALDVADRLMRAGITVDLVVADTNQPTLDRWLADLYLFCGGEPVNHDQFTMAVAAIPRLDPSWYSALVWATNSTHSVAWSDISTVSQRWRSTPEPWHQPADGRVFVSTIHQSKGKEFDNVVVLDPGQLLRPTQRDRPPELESLYVALTRARTRMFSVQWPQKYTHRANDRTGTLYRCHPGTKSLTAIEIRPSDLRGDKDYVDRAVPPVLDGLQAGSLVEFNALSATDRPVYRCTVEGRTVGMTTDDFGERLKRLARSTKPPRLGPVPIESIATAMGRSANVVEFWTTPRPHGFSEVSFGRQAT